MRLRLSRNVVRNSGCHEFGAAIDCHGFNKTLRRCM